MSDKMRWRYGDTNPVVAAVKEATVIEIGDLVWQDVDHARPASDFVDPDNPGEAPQRFVDNFLGVAMQRSRAGDKAPVRVATTGVFEFDCSDPMTCKLGDLISVYFKAVEDPEPRCKLSNQAVDLADSDDTAIGRVAKREEEPTHAVLVDIKSTVMTGGVLIRS